MNIYIYMNIVSGTMCSANTAANTTDYDHSYWGLTSIRDVGFEHQAINKAHIITYRQGTTEPSLFWRGKQTLEFCESDIGKSTTRHTYKMKKILGPVWHYRNVKLFSLCYVCHGFFITPNFSSTTVDFYDSIFSSRRVWGYHHLRNMLHWLHIP